MKRLGFDTYSFIPFGNLQSKHYSKSNDEITV